MSKEPIQFDNEDTEDAREWMEGYGYTLGEQICEKIVFFAQNVTAEKDATISKLQSEIEQLQRTVNSHGLHVAEQIKFRLNKVLDEYVVAFGNSLTDK